MFKLYGTFFKVTLIVLVKKELNFKSFDSDGDKE